MCDVRMSSIARGIENWDEKLTITSFVCSQKSLRYDFPEDDVDKDDANTSLSMTSKEKRKLRQGKKGK